MPYQLTAPERERVMHVDELVVRGSVDALLAGLGDASWTVRRAVVAGLASLGDDAVVPLCDWLRYRRTTEAAIAAAVDTLVASRGGSVTEHVTALLHDARADVAADAAAILGRRRLPESIGALRRAAVHADDNVALAAIEALGRIGGASGIDTLITATRSDNVFRVFAAVQVLAATGDPRAIAPLAALLAHPMCRDVAIAGLGRTGSVQAAPVLAELARDAPDDLALVGVALADLVAFAAWNGSAERVLDVLRVELGDTPSRLADLLALVSHDDAARLASLLGHLGTPAALAALAARIDSPLHAAALAAIAQIVQRHEDVLPEVVAHGDARVRACVVRVARSRTAAPTIRALLADEDDDTRAAACDALGRLGDLTAVPQLFALLEDPRPHVALAATAAIHSLRSPETEPLTIAVLGSGSVAARRHALRIVSYLGLTNVLPAVREALADHDPRIAELAVATLGALADPSVPGELRAMLAPDRAAATRAAAMRALAHRGNATDVLVEHLDDELPWVRHYAVQGLGRASHVPAVPALVAKLRDPSPHVRLAAVEALAGIDAPNASAAVLAAARSEDPDELRAGLLGIGNVAIEAALPVLLAAAQSPDPATRVVALSGLAKRRHREATAALVAAAGDPDGRDAAVSLLAERTDREAAEALADIAAATTDPTHPVHAALAMPSPMRISVLRQRCAGADELAAMSFASALGRMHDEAATAALLELVAVPNAISRRVAATVLAEIGVPIARELVARMSREDPDPAVRRACAASMEPW